MTTQSNESAVYDSASFEADLDRAEQYAEHLYRILDNPAFRHHVDVTAVNFSGAGTLVQGHEAILFDLLVFRNAMESWLDDIRKVG